MLSEHPADVPAVAPPSVRRQPLADALRTLSYEILPFASTEDAVLANVPRSIPLSITTTQAKGLERTVDLAVRLSAHGYATAPHLAARQVRDRRHLEDLVARLAAGKVSSVFVIGGDADTPAGEFADALGLLRALEERGHHFERVGIGGYPEGHAAIDAALIEQAMRDKAAYATHIVTQLCFDSATTVAWARRLKASGVALPVQVGLPGAVSRQKLIRISAGLGLGQSARFLKKQQNMLWRFFLPGGYRPDRLVNRLAPRLGERDTALHRFHLFTFNELERTEAWRRAWLDRLSTAHEEGR
ncbi:methylenetetrahydrofolate reductase [Phytoactinopolyspora halotolerans]|uniref:Methylenetetrahydrofolate reductase n=1 Tax=Phytoactinopolyspora halotolerans TaxID=1981512 RepID=A0A6L9S5W4_9ACTN|nr:methylenetetrahydrofolate reductase [Phytoactinopolyspora halotolerans]NEE00437.1 5,10-methylenetetrahydrofolate reductase [Phytoactinopolyspora halotolerans]